LALSRLPFVTDPPPTSLYPLPLHDALPISIERVSPSVRVFAYFFHEEKVGRGSGVKPPRSWGVGPKAPHYFIIVCATSSAAWGRSEEHTSELQSRFDLVCRLLLEKKKTYNP